jgi:hypothetical protein
VSRKKFLTRIEGNGSEKSGRTREQGDLKGIDSLMRERNSAPEGSVTSRTNQRGRIP